MKNIHIVPTTQASRLVKSKFSDTLLLADMASKRAEWKRFNIYITSNEEIKEGEWFYSPKLLDAQKLFDRRDWRKIILTTDVDLIKDGIQAIDDKFLEWFVKNPSCESVRVEGHIYKGQDETEYRIIIPEEEPKLQCKDCNDNLTDCTCIEDTVDMKQETLHEVALEFAKDHHEMYETSNLGSMHFGFIEGAKWQQEQDKNKYSEEVVIDIAKQAFVLGKDFGLIGTFKEWFDTVKKK
jgi:hypothetical protein